MEVKEAAWGAELSTRLEEERSELARRLAERDDLKEKEKQEAIEAVRTEERTAWQQQLDELVKRADQLHAEKERLEKTIRQEVDARVQVGIDSLKKLLKERWFYVVTVLFFKNGNFWNCSVPFLKSKT